MQHPPPAPPTPPDPTVRGEEPPRRLRGAARAVLAAVLSVPAVLLGCFVLLVALASVFLARPHGREALARTIERLASTPGGMELHLGTIGPGLPTRLQVDRLALADATGEWLEARDLVFAWRPAALLRARFRVSELGLASLAISRPAAAAAPAPEPREEEEVRLPRLPVRIVIDRVHIDDLILDAAVAGQPARLALDGKFAAAEDGGRIGTSLSVERRDGGTGGLALRGNFVPATRTLDIDARFAEPAGGLVATLIGLADRPALSLQVSGVGPLDGWRGTLAADAAGLGGVRADLALEAGDDLRLATTGRATIEVDPVPALRPALAQGVSFDTAVRRKPDGELILETLRVDGEGLSLAGSARLDPDGATMTAVVDVAAEERALAPGTLGPARFAAARLHVDAHGPIGGPGIEGRAGIEGIVAPEAKVGRLDLQFRASLDRRPEPGAPPVIEVTSGMEDLEPASPPLAAALGRSPKLRLQADLDEARSLLTVRELAVEGEAVRLGATGTLGLVSGALAAKAELTAADIRPIGTAAGLPAAGRIGLEATVDGGLQPPALRGAVAARTAGLATGIAAADALLGPEPRLDAGFGWDESTGATIPELKLAGRGIRADGEASLSADGKRLASRLRVEVPSLVALSGPLGTPLSGSAVLEATADGDPSDPAAAATLRVADVVADSTRITDGRVEMRASRLGSRPTGRLDARAVSPDLGPITAGVAFGLDHGRVLDLDPIDVRAFGAGVSGSVEADLQTMVAAGVLDVRTDSPEAGIRFGETALTGPLHLGLRLTPARGRQMVTADLSAGPLAIRQGEDEAARIQALSGAATITNALAAPEIAATLEASDIGIDGRRLHDLRVGANGTLARIRATLAASGAGPTPDSIEAGADISSSAGGTRVDLGRLRGRLAGFPLLLVQPARLTAGDGRIELRDLSLTLGDARLEAGARLGRRETFADVRLRALPVRLARLLTPAAPAEGTADLTVALRTEGNDTAGDVALHLRDVAVVAAPGGTATLDAGMTARLGGRRLSIDGTITGPQGSAASFGGEIPFRLPAGGTEPEIDRTGPLDGRLSVAADLGRLVRLLALHDQRIEGRVDGDMTVAGSLADPRPSGAIGLSDGVYENFVSGTLLSGLTARVAPVDNRTLALQVAGNDGGAGRLGVAGTVGLDADDVPRADIRITAERATLVRRDDVTATTDADITYSTATEPARLAGHIATTEIVVRLVNGLPPSVVELPVTEIGRPSPSARAQDATEPVAVALALDVAMPRHVFVRGRGMESEWEGSLHIAGTTAAPQITGTVALVRGTFTFGGKRFDMQRGTITFSGGQPIDPLIDAVAEYRASAITAQIRVSGFASKPTVSITSQPARPESEVLAQVLFNKSSAKLGPVEAVQLASAMEALARGESTSENALDFARTLLGLDTLAVQPSSSGEGSSVAAGRYVGERVYIGAQQGIEDGSQTGSVEIEIAPGISVTSELDQSATTGTQGALGLKWRWDY